MSANDDITKKVTRARKFLLRAAAVGSGSILAACSTSTSVGTMVVDAGTTTLDAHDDSMAPGTVVHDAGVIVDSGGSDLGILVDSGGPVGLPVLDAGGPVGTAPLDAGGPVGNSIGDAGDPDAHIVVGVVVSDAGGR